MTKKIEKPVSEDFMKITGIASFPFLAKTAKNESMYPEDKYKIDLQVDENSFEKTELYLEVKRMAKLWYKDIDDDPDPFEIASLKRLNDDLDEENDKYAKYKKDKIRIRAKAGATQKPFTYDPSKTEFIEDVDKPIIINGCKVNIFINPYCYGIPETYKLWLNKLEKVMTQRAKVKTPIEKKKLDKEIVRLNDNTVRPKFGIAFGLQGVQFLEPTSGRTYAKERCAELCDDHEVSADDVDYDSDEEEYDNKDVDSVEEQNVDL